jgi:hypothetical protein
VSTGLLARVVRPGQLVPRVLPVRVAAARKAPKGQQVRRGLV